MSPGNPGEIISLARTHIHQHKARNFHDWPMMPETYLSTQEFPGYFRVARGAQRQKFLIRRVLIMGIPGSVRVARGQSPFVKASVLHQTRRVPVPEIGPSRGVPSVPPIISRQFPENFPRSAPRAPNILSPPVSAGYSTPLVHYLLRSHPQSSIPLQCILTLSHVSLVFHVLQSDDTRAPGLCWVSSSSRPIPFDLITVSSCFWLRSVYSYQELRTSVTLCSQDDLKSTISAVDDSAILLETGHISNSALIRLSLTVASLVQTASALVFLGCRPQSVSPNFGRHAPSALQMISTMPGFPGECSVIGVTSSYSEISQKHGPDLSSKINPHSKSVDEAFYGAVLFTSRTLPM
ncbi:hypothetical protein DFH09DRAFT_1486003 [Mycena vulgaris]|nr:hypothetical protein DFH09DRAFT_1486003 [Mycena vulgaris]